jgi:hypothetical protein
MLFLSALFGLVPHAHAQGYISEVIGAVGAGMPSLGYGAASLVTIAQLFVTQLRPLLFIVGTLVITILGFRMIIGQEDESIDKAKTTIIAVLSGIMLAFLIEPFFNAFFGTAGEALNNPGAGAAIIGTEIGGILNWAMTIAGVLAITMIIVSGLKAIVSPLNEEGISNMRSTIISVIFGMLLLICRVAISIAFGATGAATPAPLIAIIVNILTFVLGFVALAAVVVIVYAGILLVLNYGRDDEISKAKGIITRAIIGIIIILVSIGIVQFVIGVF